MFDAPHTFTAWQHIDSSCKFWRCVCARDLARVTMSVSNRSLGFSENSFSATMSGRGASGSASNEPSATRRQLDQFFWTLWKEEKIATEQGCDCCGLSALEHEYDCGWIGYCYYTVSLPKAD